MKTRTYLIQRVMFAIAGDNESFHNDDVRDFIDDQVEEALNNLESSLAEEYPGIVLRRGG